ncbi:hypothetical protein J1N35_024029 [Gossypium stocksii]|uniref:Uncharacterized protein n=1 Tax=Gossypium stocksii TaxID=47602 RepID=A0A9D3VJM0_9ROSI|nr:hypothetical protein J1N35_024029 [Gossypium stocksii]
MDTLYNNMKAEMDDLKKCYDPKELEKYSNDNEKLAWIFFVDGCAILQAIYMSYVQRSSRAEKMTATGSENGRKGVDE